jgi:hypothetical protein
MDAASCSVPDVSPALCSSSLGGSGKRRLADGRPSAIGKAFGLADATRIFPLSSGTQSP